MDSSSARNTSMRFHKVPGSLSRSSSYSKNNNNSSTSNTPQHLHTNISGMQRSPFIAYSYNHKVASSPPTSHSSSVSGFNTNTAMNTPHQRPSPTSNNSPHQMNPTSFNRQQIWKDMNVVPSSVGIDDTSVRNSYIKSQHQMPRSINDGSSSLNFAPSLVQQEHHSTNVLDGGSLPGSNNSHRNSYMFEYNSSMNLDDQNALTSTGSSQYQDNFHQYSNYNGGVATTSINENSSAYQNQRVSCGPTPSPSNVRMNENVSIKSCESDAFGQITFGDAVQLDSSSLDHNTTPTLSMNFETCNNNNNLGLDHPNYSDETIQMMPVLEHANTSTLSKNYSHPVTPESGDPTPFDCDLNYLAQEIVDNYQNTGTVQMQPHYLHEQEHHMNVHDINYLCGNEVPKTEVCGSPVNHNQSPFIENNDANNFTKPQTVSPNICQNNNRNSPYGSGIHNTSPLQQFSPSPMHITKTEPVFTPPASPFDGNHYSSYPTTSMASGSSYVFQTANVDCSRQHSSPDQLIQPTMSFDQKNKFGYNSTSTLRTCDQMTGSASGIIPEQNYRASNAAMLSNSVKANTQSKIDENDKVTLKTLNESVIGDILQSSNVPQPDIGGNKQQNYELESSNKGGRNKRTITKKNSGDCCATTSGRGRRRSVNKKNQYEVAYPSEQRSKNNDTSIPKMRIRRKSSSADSDAGFLSQSSDTSFSSSRLNDMETTDTSCIAEEGPRSNESNNFSKNGSPRTNRSTSNHPPGAKICGVCGDIAKSMHFGGMACDSCKAFFRRSVQGRSWTEFRCANEQNCTISKKNRKNCQYCRFAKCRNNGMEPSWVMSEADRMALWKNRLSKHRKGGSGGRPPRQPRSNRSDSEGSNTNDEFLNASPNDQSRMNQPLRPSIDEDIEEEYEDEEDSQDRNSISMSSEAEVTDSLDLTKGKEFTLVTNDHVIGTTTTEYSSLYPLHQDDLMKINNLIALQEAVFQANPYPKCCYGDSVDSMANLFVYLCKRIGTFFHRVEEFHSLIREDQLTLLKTGIAMSVYLHGAYVYDPITKCWPRKECKENLKVPPISTETLHEFAGIDEVFNLVIEFYEENGKYFRDEGVVAIVSLITLFQVPATNESVVEKRTINDIRDNYINLLEKYLKYRRGEEANRWLPKVLGCLEKTRRISEFHSKIDIKPTVSVNDMVVSPTSSSFSDQLIGVCDFVKQSSQASLSEYSSVLSIQERLQSIAGPSNSLLSLELPSTPVDLPYHHSLTKAIFGEHNRTDMLFTDALEHIAQYKQKLLSLPYEPESFQNYRSSPSVHSFASVSGSSTVEDSSGRETASPPSLSPRPKAKHNRSRTNSRNSCSPYPTPVILNSPQGSSSPISSPGPSRSTHSPGANSDVSSNNKKKGIKVLCEMLEYISKCDDPEAIESLQSSLPPYVLKNLAAKLNIR